MQIDRVIYPITTLGPGNRVVIFTVGCGKGCAHCANPELWPSNPSRDIGVDNFFSVFSESFAHTHPDGITITGGDPLEQRSDMLALLPKLRTFCDDILVYTGYTLEELSQVYGEKGMSMLRDSISVLIDGRYIDRLNDNSSALRGSVNQRVVFFDEGLKGKYAPTLAGGRSVQNVFYQDKLISVGIHSRI